MRRELARDVEPGLPDLVVYVVGRGMIELATEYTRGAWIETHRTDRLGVHPTRTRVLDAATHLGVEPGRVWSVISEARYARLRVLVGRARR